VNDFSAPPAPDLNLIEPGTEFSDVSAYTSPNFNPSPTPATSSASGMMFASMGLSAIGAITNAFSRASALKAQGDYESTIANTNAKIANLQASQALEAGDMAASRKNLQTQQQVGAIKAAQGASGVDVASGSSAAVRAGAEGAGAVDELTIRNNAQRQAWGYQTEAINDTFKGQFAQLTAKAGATQSLLAGGLQAIEGPLSIESNYLRWSRYMGGGSGAGVPFPNMSTGN
jgi:hypothetical protein